MSADASSLTFYGGKRRARRTGGRHVPRLETATAYQGDFGLVGSGGGTFNCAQGDLGLVGSGGGTFRWTQGDFGLVGSGGGTFKPARNDAALHAPTDNATIADAVKIPR